MKRRLLLLLACVFLLIFAAAASEGAESSKAEEKEHNYTEEEYKRIYSYREHIKNMTVNAEINKDGTITINEDTATVLSVSDFGFSDIDTGSALSSVKITSLASDGTLE